jgi:cytochrome c
MFKNVRFASAFAAAPVGVALLSGSLALPAAEPEPTAAATQIAAGATAYFERCASCHGERLSGATQAPSLKGATFVGSWAGKPARMLYRRVISTMPLTDPGTLEPKMALDITIFLLSANEQSIPAAGYQSADELNGVPIKCAD